MKFFSQSRNGCGTISMAKRWMSWVWIRIACNSFSLKCSGNSKAPMFTTSAPCGGGWFVPVNAAHRAQPQPLDLAPRQALAAGEERSRRRQVSSPPLRALRRLATGIGRLQRRRDPRREPAQAREGAHLRCDCRSFACRNPDVCSQSRSYSAQTRRTDVGRTEDAERMNRKTPTRSKYARTK